MANYKNIVSYNPVSSKQSQFTADAPTEEWS